MKAEQAKIQNTDVLVCEDSLQHIHAELTRVDKLIEISIYKFRHHIRAAEKYVSSVPTYVTDDEVAWLITGDADDYSYHDEEIVQLYQQLESIELEIDELVTNSLEQGITLPLANIAKLFNLSWLEYQAILLCLAPELRRRYDRIFSYLQDDITRKKPSLDLLLSIFCNTEQERWQARHLLNSESSLVKFELIDLIELNRVEVLVIANKGRLVRFGYEILEHLCNRHGTNIETIEKIEKSEEQELVEDLINIVTVFNVRLNGKRSHSRKKLMENLDALREKS